jgi:hypothetical protein
MSSTLVSAASSTGAFGEPEPLGAQPHLRHRLLAGNIDDAVAAVGERRAGLDQQRRLADAGLAADQHHGARHEAAAGDAVEFGDAGGDARRRPRLAGQALKLEHAALARAARRLRADARTGVLLENRIPFATGLAFALPALRDRAAILADETGSGFGHVDAREGRKEH